MNKVPGDAEIKKVEGVFALETAAGQVAVFIGNEVVAKFDAVESWWREKLIQQGQPRAIESTQAPS
jgi:hypothetical protein